MAFLRLFIAVEITDKTIISKILSIQQDIRLNGIKRSKLEHIHFTLHFIGNTPPNKISTITTCFDEIEIKPFSINLFGCGAFPNIKKPRIIWVGVDEGKDVLKDLQKQIGQCLQSQGFNIDDRIYVPHITIARVKKINHTMKTQISNLLFEYKEFNLGTILIDKVCLKQSTLTSSGPIYKNIFVKELVYESD